MSVVAPAAKTYDQWSDSDQSLTDFIKPFDEIDEAIYNHMLGVVPPQYHERTDTGWLLQSGETEYSNGGTDYYMTFSQVGQQFFYLGILPQFQQHYR